MKTEKQQTAVEWIEGYLKKFNHIEESLSLKKAFEQAKEMERDQKIECGKRCFYKGFEKAENDDANCFTAWREAVDKLFNL